MTMPKRSLASGRVVLAVLTLLSAAPHLAAATESVTSRKGTSESSSSSSLRAQIAREEYENAAKEEDLQLLKYYGEWNPYEKQEKKRMLQQGSKATKYPERAVNYTIWTAEQIEGTLLRWGEHYSDFISVTTAQDAYNLPAAGGPNDCPFQVEQDGCLNYIATIQDFVTYPEGSEAEKHLPEVLWSGELHGNEQVGPSAVMEAASLLLMAAECTAYPRWSAKNSPTEWENELNRAKECRQEWKDYGYEDWQRLWLARLVSTRRIVVVPTANALGYFQSRREENRIDPNRDFPFDLTDPTQCMRTIAGRTLNEVFREHVFQLSLTFHAGMQVVGYEWGAPTYKGGLSPDHIAQSQIGKAYSNFGGGFLGVPPYRAGPMNDLVYPVRGGMEDWAYAGSWDTARVIQCEPTTFDPYPKSQTVYDDATLRVFNMLVETSDNKMPKTQLGSSVDVLSAHQYENGHVARNLRLALLAAELVQPWAAFRQVNELELTDDIIPNLDLSSGRQICQQTKHLVVPRDSRKVVVQWEVGGSLTIDETKLWYAKWSDIPTDKLNCLNQPDKSIMGIMTEGTAISKTSGTTRFAQMTDGFSHFSASIDISGYKPHDLLVVLVSAKVDQEWKEMPSQVFLPKNTPPQSHMANARTNEDWHYVSSTSGNIVQGRVVWFSDPMTIEIGEIRSAKSVKTVELSQRVPMGPQPGHRPSDAYTQPVTSEKQPWSPMEKFVLVMIIAVAALLLVVGGRAFLRMQMRQTHRERLREFIADPTAPSPGLKATSGRGKGGRQRGEKTGLSNGEYENGNGGDGGDGGDGGGGDLELKVYRDDEEIID